MDIKNKAHLLKARAKDLGIDLKHTHALELLAALEGHRSRHSALLEEKNKTPSKPQTTPEDVLSTYEGIKVNHNCQLCRRQPRSNARYIFSGNPQIWLLCDYCGPHASEGSKFSIAHGAKDLTKSYDIHQTYIRDISFIQIDKKTKYEYSVKKAFFFRLILSDGTRGDRYMFVPGLWSGHSEVKVWNLDTNEEANGWWDWPIELLPMPKENDEA